MTDPDRPREVLVIASLTSSAYARGVVEGLGDHVRRSGRWNVQLTATCEEDLPSGVFDGIFTASMTPQIRERLLRFNGPAVSVSSNKNPHPIPAVLNDNPAIGRLAASHLLDRRLPQLACCGPATVEFTQQRLNAFEALAHKRGVPCHRLDGRFQAPGLSQYQAHETEAADWLSTLPLPFGLFVPTDNIAQSILRVCRRLKLRVPDDIAVVGVNDDQLVAGVSQPPLTSIALPTQRIGQTAGELLDQLMAGHPPPDAPIRFAPLGVRARQSSDRLAIDDPAVVRAYRFIQNHAHRPILPADVHADSHVPRRTLETRFRKHTGRSLGQAILHAHIDRARDLLANTDLTLPELAERSGFRHPENLHAAFRKITGQTPRAFRNALTQPIDPPR